MPQLRRRPLVPVVHLASTVALVAASAACAPPEPPLAEGEGATSAAADDPAAELVPASPGLAEGSADLRLSATVEGERVAGREVFVLDLRATQQGRPVDADVRVSAGGEGGGEQVAARTGAGRYEARVEASRVAWLRLDVAAEGAAVRDVRIALPRLHAVTVRHGGNAARAGGARVTWTPARDARIEEVRVEVVRGAGGTAEVSDVLPDDGEAEVTGADLADGAEVVVRRAFTQRLLADGAVRVDLVGRAPADTRP